MSNCLLLVAPVEETKSEMKQMVIQMDQILSRLPADASAPSAPMACKFYLSGV